MEKFHANPYPETEEKRELAKSLNISEKKVNKWFVRRRNAKRESLLLKGE